MTNWFVWYLCIVNSLLFILMFYDKKQAQSKGWRVPEKRLLILGLLGGGFGGLLAQQVLHHKNRKSYFYLIYIMGIVLICGIFYLIYA